MSSLERIARCVRDAGRSCYLGVNPYFALIVPFRWSIFAMTRVAVFILALLCASVSWAAETDAAPTLKDVLDSDEKTEELIADSQADKETEPGETPLSTILAILQAKESNDWDAAGSYLDMRYLPPEMSQADKATLIKQLAIVWGQQRILDLTQLSNQPEGHRDDGLPSYRDLLGTLNVPDGSLSLYLQRVPENGGRVWKISNASVQEIPMLWELYGYNPAITRLAHYLPDFTWLHMHNWQVAGLVLMVLGAGLVSSLMRRVALRLLALSERYRDTLHRFFSVPLRWFLFFKILQLGVAELGLPLRAQVYVNQHALGYLANLFLVIGMIELLTALFLSNTANKQYWSGIIRPLRTILKMLAIAVMFLLWLRDSGYDITTVLTGLGIGSIAVALAAQKTLENVIGAFTMYIAKPFQPGDFCSINGVTGVIEEIGLRSTRIRRTDRTVVHVPNGSLASASIENISETDNRRFHRNVYIRLGASADQLRALLADLRRLIYSHPRLTDVAARVRFEEILRDSYRISLNAYLDSGDYSEFLAVSEDLNLRILAILESHQLRLAVPVQQWIQGEESQSPAPQTAEVDEAFPDFSDEEKRAMRGSIDYPEKGLPSANK